MKWTFFYDLVFSCLCLLPFFVAALLPDGLMLLKRIAMYLSLFLVLFMLLLNAVDIFYFPFHKQRADADLLYVLRNPFFNGTFKVWLIVLTGLVLLVLTGFYFYRQIKNLNERFLIKKPIVAVLFVLFVSLVFIAAGSKLQLPGRPLTEIAAEKLPLVQNSLHSFLYSVYRGDKVDLKTGDRLSAEERNLLFNIKKQNVISPANVKNIVLFIMESVPYEFFDSTNAAKPELPFFDSLLNHASFYNNAFSYSYSSNKGITAILAGIPTITDIPLYHSGFVNINKTAIGSRLAAKGYSSSFFIGDNYDDFGFAKCCNWLGIQNYYCMQDIPGYKKMEKHSMGLHDEYVLSFMQGKMKEMQQPFFATQYNISTHYPNDLTDSFKKKLSNLKISAAAKSMLYYDACMQHFFAEAKKQPWYNNTVFIFCSDHWATPVQDAATPDIVNSFRIPIIIFDPADNKKKLITEAVSQFDIMNTVLAYASDKEPFISYGASLLESSSQPRTVFTKTNNAVYQAINDSMVLGFDAGSGRAVFAYKREPNKNTLVNSNGAGRLMLEKEMKAFLQTAVDHYRSKGQKDGRN